LAHARILVIDDEKLIRWSLQKNLERSGYIVEIAESGEEGLVIFEEFDPDAVIIDNKLPGANGIEIMSEIHNRDPRVIMLFMTAFGTIELAVEAMKRGAYDYVNKPFVYDEIKQLLEKAFHLRGLDSEVARLKDYVHRQYDTDNVIAESQHMKDILELIDKIARSAAPTVLLTGESGVGKDLLARLLHQRCPRRNNPFITINCASLPETLLESELFGHEKGSFTDAKSMKRGQFELAANGTIYLDEIGEISLGTQVNLLQVIENRLFKRVGGIKDLRIDSLVIAATNIDLAAAVASGRFRRDLFYRLNLIPIEIPPLRERRSDIVPIALFFMRRFNEDFHRQFKGISEDAKTALTRYNWPGNIRELRNVIERIVILEDGQTINVENLPVELIEQGGFSGDHKSNAVAQLRLEIPESGLSMEAVEHELVVKALEKAGNNQTKAAVLLSITRDSLRYKMKKFKLL